MRQSDLPKWWHLFVRRVLPGNYHGDLVLRFDNGHLVKVIRHDEWNEKVFFSRYHEEAIKLEVSNGSIAADGSDHERLTGQ